MLGVFDQDRHKPDCTTIKADNFVLGKYVAKTNNVNSCAVHAQKINVFVFAHANITGFRMAQG